VFAIAATSTEIKLRPAGETAAVEVLHRLPSRPLDDGLAIELGELAVGTPRQVLFKLIRVPDATDRKCGTLTVTFQNADGTAGDGHLLGIELPETVDLEHRKIITLERTRLQVASAVDTAWARRASGDSVHALATLSDMKAEVVSLRESRAADDIALSALLQDIAEAENAVVKSSAERERARRSMRERSHITLLGHSTIGRVPPREDE